MDTVLPELILALILQTDGLEQLMRPLFTYAYPSRIGNPDLTWEKRKEFSIGIDALMFNHKLSFEVNYYNNLRDGKITQLTNTLPYIAGISSCLTIVTTTIKPDTLE